jgi:hypothetical protein
MRRELVALAICAALGAPVLSRPASAGGRVSPPRGIGGHAFRTVPAGVKAAPELHATTAFGSPGGFPFRGWDSYHQRTVVVRSGHRSPRHVHAGRFPRAEFLYAPAALSGYPVEPLAPVVSVAPVIHASPIVYVSPTVIVPERAPVAVAPTVAPPPPEPGVIEHPTGRYELRGDGVTTPYRWVWIPNPPAAPPDLPIPPSGGPAADSPRASSRSTTYRWTDDEGTTFWTNRPESIPEAHRSRARGPGEIGRP